MPFDSPVRNEGAEGFGGTRDGIPGHGDEGVPKGLVVLSGECESDDELAPVVPEGVEPAPTPPVPPEVSCARRLWPKNPQAASKRSLRRERFVGVRGTGGFSNPAASGS